MLCQKITLVSSAPGISQRKNGRTKREVFDAEKLSVEAKKINASHASNGP
jgi:hypothetical protein